MEQEKEVQATENEIDPKRLAKAIQIYLKHGKSPEEAEKRARQRFANAKDKVPSSGSRRKHAKILKGHMKDEHRKGAKSVTAAGGFDFLKNHHGYRAQDPKG